ncbi:uncharacterized protein UV8b_05769 [Ustilaginoidea virens]|uniref:Uncharacterized protein n=1 Tax=Ustilaginoidea virens TaxID=1159556 RepID=A0A8E5MIZ8_USTVR|nr:uncharacterized protein UV8b_05769 [Ustilaginoidea virens]QUC21526.1 hypothetical protein UV8b_05769 [Ustilaginoidea virens]
MYLSPPSVPRWLATPVVAKAGGVHYYPLLFRRCPEVVRLLCHDTPPFPPAWFLAGSGVLSCNPPLGLVAWFRAIVSSLPFCEL